MAVRALSDIERTTLIPAEKLLALTQLSDQVLKTRGSEYTLIDRGIRGRDADQPKTFGDLRDEEDFDVFSDGVRKAGLDNDIGSKQKKAWATVVGLITPDLAICEECNKYPIALASGVPSLLTEGRCPHCGRGLITAPKQEEPYLAWTTLQMVSPGQTHDRLSLPHLPLPLSNTAIEADAGRAFYQIDTEVRLALVQEDLTREGQVDFVKFLAYLAHGPLANRFRGKDEVIVSLGNPRAFGAFDLVSIRDTVRKAKAWTPSTTSTELSAPTTSSPGKAMRLEELLVELFVDSGELSRFLSESFGHGFRRNLPGGNVPLSELAYQAVRAVISHGYQNEEFFDKLIQIRPGRRHDIEATRRLTLG